MEMNWRSGIINSLAISSWLGSIESCDFACTVLFPSYSLTQFADTIYTLIHNLNKVSIFITICSYSLL